MFYQPESYRHAFTATIPSIGVFCYTRMTRNDTDIWIKHEIEGDRQSECYRLNRLGWYELSPFERIREISEIYMSGDGPVLGQEDLKLMTRLYHSIELDGPDACLRLFLRICMEEPSGADPFNLQSPLWEDCCFFPERKECSPSRLSG